MYQSRVHQHTCALCSACCCIVCDTKSKPTGALWHSSCGQRDHHFYLDLFNITRGLARGHDLKTGEFNQMPHSACSVTDFLL